jgi:hypothetical protein
MPAPQHEEVSFADLNPESPPISPPFPSSSVPQFETPLESEQFCVVCSKQDTVASLILMDEEETKGYFHMKCLESRLNDPKGTQAVMSLVSKGLMLVGASIVTAAVLLPANI